MNAIIDMQGLTRRFGDKLAVDSLDLQVYQGEIFGFLGHNGAGKTTTIRLLNGVLTPSAGSATVLGISPTTDGPALRKRTGVLTENPSLEERLTARENLNLFCELYNVESTAVAGRIQQTLAMFNLEDRADEKVGGYSKGMKQRLALARALLHKPDIIFLDEPTSGLDPVAAHHVHELITHLAHEEGRTVFICTHNLNEAQRLCDRVAVLEHGRMVALGAPADLTHQMGRSLGVEIEVDPQSIPQAMDILRAVPGAGNLSEQNGGIEVPGIRRELIPDLLAPLFTAGISIYKVAPKEPTLEDFYFALHGEHSEKEVLA